MDITALQAKLRDWDLPMSPFQYIEEIYREMEEETHKWGTSGATELAQALVKLEREGDPLVESLDEFLEMYSRHYPNELAEALILHLSPTGPPVLVELLGCTGSTKAVTQLKHILTLDDASDDLLEALTGALEDIGGNESLKMLQSMQQRDNLSRQVKDKINTAIANILNIK